MAYKMICVTYIKCSKKMCIMVGGYVRNCLHENVNVLFPDPTTIWHFLSINTNSKPIKCLWKCIIWKRSKDTLKKSGFVLEELWVLAMLK